MAFDEFGGVIQEPKADEFVASSGNLSGQETDEFGGIVQPQQTDEFGGVIQDQQPSGDESVSVGEKFAASTEATALDAVAAFSLLPEMAFKGMQEGIAAGPRKPKSIASDGTVEYEERDEPMGLGKFGDEAEKFAVDRIKKAEGIRARVTEQNEPIMKLIKEKRVGDVGEKIGEMAIMETPRLAIQIALAYLSRGGSLGYMGTSAAGVKYGSLADAGLSDRKRLINAVGTGSLEALFEMTGTGRIANKAFSGKFKKGAAKKAKELAIDMIGGGVSEGMTQVGENELDKLVGLDADLGGGVAEAFILGSLFDGGFSVSGMIGSARKTDRIKDGLVASGATEQEADAIIAKSEAASTAGEHNEIDKEIKVVLDTNKEANNSGVAQTIAEYRADEILEKETLSEADNAELDEITDEVDAPTAFEIRKQQETKNANDTTQRDGTGETIQEDGQEQVASDSGQVSQPDDGEQVAGQERDGEVVFHGSASDKGDFDGNEFFTDSEAEASAYAELKALERVVDNNDELRELVNEIMGDENVDSIQDLDVETIHNIIEANDLDVDVTSDKGVVSKRSLSFKNQADITKYGSEITDIEQTWSELFDDGLVDDKWSDLDDEAQFELKDQYNGKAIYKLFENEGIYDRLFKDGFDSIKFTDQGLGGKTTHNSYLVADKAQITQSKPSQPTGDPKVVLEEKVSPTGREGAKTAPETERMVEGSDSVGIAIDRMNVRLKEQGSALLEDVDVKALQTSMNNAIESGQVDTIEELAHEASIKGGIQFNDEQVMAAGARLTQLQNQIEIFEDMLDSAESEFEIDAIKKELSNRIYRSNNLMFGLRDAVTDSARAVRAMGSVINKQDYSVSSMMHQAILSKGEPLTPEEEVEVTEKARDVRKAQKVVTDKQGVEKKQNLQQKINDLTENIRFMKRTIEKRKGKKAQSNDQKRLVELRRIERQQDTIAELLNVLRNERTNAQQKKLVNDPEGYIDTISNLRTEIRDSAWYKTLQKEATKDTKKQKRLDALNAKLETLESQMAGKYRNIPEGKDTKVADADITALQDSITEVGSLMRIEDQIADLDEQIRTGIFRTEEKAVAKQQSKALTDAKTLLHQRQREAREKIYSLRTETLSDKFKNWATLPRSLMATADMSYGLRQGILPALYHPKIAAKTWGKAFQATFSTNTADEIDVAMREDPLFDEMVKYGTHFSSQDSAISNRTEFFASNLAEQIPGFGKVVQASERNMVTGINMLRYGLMKDFLAKHPDAPIEAKEAYAKYINVATGRGEAQFLDKSAEHLSLVFFAPRFAFSRVQAPFLAASNLQHPELREEMVKQWVSYLGTGATILALAKLAGADVEDDPDDSDWGKIVFGGNKRIDIWGGVQQPMRLLAKNIKGATEHIVEGETDVNPIEDMWRFLSYKLSPPVLMLNELVSGQDIIGRETEPFEIPDFIPMVGGVEIPTPARVAVENLTPLIFQSAGEAWDEGESIPMAAALMVGEGLGLSIGVYDK